MEEGMYIRTRWSIYRILKINEDDKPNTITIDDGFNSRVTFNSIIKSSFNLIDLIEVGDYVNGKEVIKYKFFTNEEPALAIQLVNENDELCYRSLNSKRLVNDGIKTILTKEQYEANCYKVGD